MPSTSYNAVNPKSKQLEVFFSEERLVADLEHITSTDWIHHYLTQHHYIQGDYHIAPLYAANGNPKAYSDFTSKQCPTSLLEHTPYFQKVLSFFECEFARVRVMRMAPGTMIAEHIDQMDIRSEIQLARFHVPIVTNPDAYFVFSGENMHMAPGECWYIEPALPHGAGNRGKADRIHLVIDCVVNDFVNTLVGFDIAECRKSRADEYAHHMRLFKEEWSKNVPQDTPSMARRLCRKGMRLLHKMKTLG
jgi:hypothetical protein